MTPFLQLKHIFYSYHTRKAETPALQDLSLSIDPGEFVSVIGPSGCGKSTLLSLICGLIQPESGEVEIKGLPLDKSATNIGYMLQKDHLFEWRTVFSNVALGLDIQHKNLPAKRNHLSNMMDNYGLGQFTRAYPSELSGGMRQRAALIRTLALEPELLLLDEPFSALDYQTRITVCDDICAIIKKESKTALLVTHDLAEAISVGRRIIVLSRRPAGVKYILEMNFSDDETPLSRRNSPLFAQYFNQLWRKLNEEQQ